MPLGAFKAALMGTAGVSTASVVLLSDQDASDSATLAVSSGIDSNYACYVFKFYNLHPVTDGVTFGFQVNGAGESGFNETITSSSFRAYQGESEDPLLTYNANGDQAQGTGYQQLAQHIGNDNDQSLAGELSLFNPSSTTYVKQFISETLEYSAANYAIRNFTGGYINTTTAIDEISFKFSSGNIQTGTIKMWGVK
jgi:hypothetical protein